MNKLILIFALIFIFVACKQNDRDISSESDGSFEITNSWMRPGVEKRNTAAFMTIINNTQHNDTLLTAESDLAKVVELHETFTRENDLKGMRHVNSIPIPANSKVELKPGGFHVMLIGLNKELKKEDGGKIQLTFKRNGTVSVLAKVD